MQQPVLKKKAYFTTVKVTATITKLKHYVQLIISKDICKESHYPFTMETRWQTHKKIRIINYNNNNDALSLFRQ